MRAILSGCGLAVLALVIAACPPREAPEAPAELATPTPAEPAPVPAQGPAQEPPTEEVPAGPPSAAFLARFGEEHPDFEQTVSPPLEACGVVELYIERGGGSKNAFRAATGSCHRVRLKATQPRVEGGDMRDRLRYVEVRCHDPEGAVQTWQALAESGKADTGLSYAYDYVAVSGSTVQWLSTDACAFEGIFREGEELLRSVLAAGGAPPAHVLTCACGQPCAPEQPAL